MKQSEILNWNNSLLTSAEEKHLQAIADMEGVSLFVLKERVLKKFIKEIEKEIPPLPTECFLQ